MTQKLPLPQLNGDVLDYDVGQTNRLNDIADYVVDYGSNANGSWEKWNSGKLVQWGGFVAAILYTSAYGGDLFYYTATPLPYPIPFISPPEYLWDLKHSTKAFVPAGAEKGSSTQKGRLRFVQSFNDVVVSGEFSWMAIGRWK